MKKVCFLFLLFNISVFGQGLITPIVPAFIGPQYSDADWLVKNKFAPNGYNIKVLNSPTKYFIRHFTGPKGFGIEDGIILSTGNINIAVPPNSRGSGGASLPLMDSDLKTSLINLGMGDKPIFSITSLVFEFTALSDSISFDYIFSSFEYPDYICSDYNDVFGFYLKGKHINGYPSYSIKNLATIPGTTTPVAINSVNQGFPGVGGIDSLCSNIDTNYSAYSQYYVDNNLTFPSSTPQSKYINHKGYTKVLTAKAQVKCGETYVIKIAIANVGDNALNSAVYLKSNSFKTNNFNIKIESDTLELRENCNSALVSIKGNIPQPNDLTIKLKVKNLTTGITDYTYIPDSLTIPQGDTMVQFNIEAIQDYLLEPTENFRIIFEYGISCVTILDSLDFVIYNNQPLSTHGGNIEICPTDSIYLKDYFTGGFNTDIIGDKIIYADSNIGSYIFTVMDECGDFKQDSILISLFNPASGLLTYTDVKPPSPGDLWEITLSMNLFNVSYYYFIINGDTTTDLNITSPTTQDVNVILRVESSDGCLGWDTLNIKYDGFETHIPNAFTPNGDGNNDIFKWYISPVKTFSMKIYDRWGNKIFETDNPHIYWSGSNSSVGAYTYRMTFIKPEKLRVIVKMGEINLIR